MRSIIVTACDKMREEIVAAFVSFGHSADDFCRTLGEAREYFNRPDINRRDVLWVIDSHIGSALPSQKDSAVLPLVCPCSRLCRDIRKNCPETLLLGMTRQGCSTDALMFDSVEVWHHSMDFVGWDGIPLRNAVDYADRARQSLLQ